MTEGTPNEHNCALLQGATPRNSCSPRGSSAFPALDEIGSVDRSFSNGHTLTTTSLQLKTSGYIYTHPTGIWFRKRDPRHLKLRFALHVQHFVSLEGLN